MRIRTYAELSQLGTFDERFAYLTVQSQVGAATFGFERYLNQTFYTSPEWKRARRDTIARDGGCDLGIPGLEIHYRPIIHHMNPITIEDIQERNPDILDPRFLITTTLETHNAIHYGTLDSITSRMVERVPGDTLLW